ncbi:MAG: UDP-N-acetylglucosamine 2-epimerase (non-hydrolyzing) [Tannerella sp.]|jgi:UDP-N-acetylglucosamine 2-epimerase (non-hydrolysing)|nr:UDP-N-acetylglucosamine 2-epimerase (non-hydrolyzing) [Tannerella sp.]
MKKMMLVFGTRPEAIKMAPLVKEFQKYPEHFTTIVCVTGQHREMLDQVLNLFEIVPDYDLNIMKQGQDLYDITSKILLGMRDVLVKEKPDMVLVHGDTTTSTATALSAFYQQIPVGHVEAGLRTHNIYSPWPEEMNRQITGRIATFNFAPTPLSRQNLLDESIDQQNIIVTGNTVIDALLYVSEKLNTDALLKKTIEQSLSQLGLPKDKQDKWVGLRKLVLITGHRRENFGTGFLNMCEAIRQLSHKYPQVDFVYPVHLNPNVQKPVYELLKHIPNVFLINPLEYLPFVYLMQQSHLILTDSGGVQEEAPGLGKPVLVMRDTTERPEAVEAGTVKLVGTDKDKIIQTFDELMNNKNVYQTMSEAINPYGDGKACSRIVSALINSI